MKPSAVLLSIGLLSSALTAVAVAGHLAWTSLTTVTESAPIAQAKPNASPAQPSAPSSSNQQAGQSVTNVSTASAPSQASTAIHSAPQLNSPQPSASSAPVWSQQENDYLFDLSQALQPIERDRLTATDQVSIARNIQAWLATGADYWGVREQFDATYRNSVAGNYGHNRDVYIRFATAHFAPDYLASVMQPPMVLEGPMPYPMPYPQADGFPYPGAYPSYPPDAPYAHEPYYGGPYPNLPYPSRNSNPPQAPAPQLPNMTEVAM